MNPLVVRTGRYLKCSFVWEFQIIFSSNSLFFFLVPNVIIDWGYHVINENTYREKAEKVRWV
jgi:hypothetical protein